MAKCTPDATISDNFDVRAISCETLSEQPTNGDDHSGDHSQCGSDDNGDDVSHGVTIMVTAVIIVIMWIRRRMFLI